MGEIHFHPEALIEAAMESTEMNDFGRLPVRPGLGVLCETYERNVQDPEGRKRCRDRLINLLTVRLRCEHAFRKIPSIAEQEIKAPIFITGLPRSGTSALVNLLSQAPENRGLLQWEVQFPDPWPGSASGATDPRYLHLVKALAENRNPEFEKIHYVDADTPEECVLLHAYAFSGVQLGFEIMLEPYRSWLLEQDLTTLYDYQKRQLQLLSWRNPGGRWVLKAPAHMWAVNVIRRVFPDARFVWCHRHPVPVVASINSMTAAIMDMFMGDWSHLDPAKIGHAVMEWYAMSLDCGLTARETLPQDLFVDCSQAEIADRPLGVVEHIYEHLGLDLSGPAAEAMQAFIAANPKGKHGQHDYDLTSFGLTEEEVVSRFDFYLQDSRWPISD